MEDKLTDFIGMQRQVAKEQKKLFWSTILVGVLAAWDFFVIALYILKHSGVNLNNLIR